MDMIYSRNIGYRGPITYRGLRFIALIAMTLSQFAMVFSFLFKGLMLAAGQISDYAPSFLFRLCSALGHISFPLLLIASFALVVSKPDEIIRTLLMNLGLAVLTFIFCAFFLEKMVIGVINDLPGALLQEIDLQGMLRTIADNPQILSGLGVGDVAAGGGIDADLIAMMTEVIADMDITSIINEILPEISGDISRFIIAHYININVFWDLFLCTLFYFFISFNPKKLAGGKLVIFRCCAVLPVAYIIASTFLDGLNKNDIISLPTWEVAMLTNRKLPCYILFFLIVMFFKYREAEFISRGGERSLLPEIMTNKDTSLAFSIFVSISLIVVSGLDWLLGRFAFLTSWGIGSSYRMLYAVPFVMLFSFSKKPKRKWPDIFIPVYYIVNYAVLIFLIMGLTFSIPEFLENLAGLPE